jgi:hypothetical protein
MTNPRSRLGRALIGPLLAAALGGCGSTGGHLISVPLQAGGLARDSTVPLTFTTSSGWTVTLTNAHLSVGPIYLNASPPSTFDQRSGVVLIQMTEQIDVDALDPTLHDVAGGADGETGHTVAAEVDLLPPGSDNGANPNGGNIGSTSGTAVSANGLSTVSFSGPIAIDTSLTSRLDLARLQRVLGASADLDFQTAPQMLELRVDPKLWFDSIDFATLPPAPGGGPRTWTSSSTFMATLVEGVRSATGVYDFQLANPP